MTLSDRTRAGVVLTHTKPTEKNHENTKTIGTRSFRRTFRCHRTQHGLESALGQEDVLVSMEAAPLNPLDFMFVRGI
jgi:hypothetical protein